MTTFSIVLPARNEAANLERLLPELHAQHPQAEIIVVNDGSNDETLSVCEGLGIRCVSHPYSMGNGAAIKTGARQASYDVIVFMDADGQHDPATIEALVAPPLWLHMVIWPPLVVIGALALLRPMKGLMIALQFHHKASDSGTESYD